MNINAAYGSVYAIACFIAERTETLYLKLKEAISNAGASIAAAAHSAQSLLSRSAVWLKDVGDEAIFLRRAYLGKVTAYEINAIGSHKKLTAFVINNLPDYEKEYVSSRVLNALPQEEKSNLSASIFNKIADKLGRDNFHAPEVTHYSGNVLLDIYRMRYKSGVHADVFNSLADREKEKLSGKIINLLPDETIKALDASVFNSIAAREKAKLSGDMINLLPDETRNALDVSVFNSVARAEITKLNGAVLNQLPDNTLKAFTKSTVMAISVSAISELDRRVMEIVRDILLSA